MRKSALTILAKEYGLKGKLANAYYKFMQKRFPKERSVSYSATWARRFSRGDTSFYADKKSKAVLVKLGVIKKR